jgi:cyclic pyranopterin phosphate synthase
LDVKGNPLSLPMVKPLVDTFGRRHNNLRISVTDHCNLRCTYCMPEDVEFLDKHEILTFEEIARFVEIAASLGVDKVRLTGGEPLLRRQLPQLVEMIVGVPGIRDVGLTTNGILLAEQAQSLYDAGLRRINVSLDALDEARFRQMARRDGVDRVLAGIREAKRVGFDPIKLNAVAIRGVTEGEIVPLARFAREHDVHMRFIEYMPIGASEWERAKVLYSHEILDRIECDVGDLMPVGDGDVHSPATEFAYADGGGTIGVIASVSRPFCQQCNRIRLTADGKLRNCLFAVDEVDIKSLLRGGATSTEIARAIRDNVRDKWEGHTFNTSGFVKPQRTMHTIGG